MSKWDETKIMRNLEIVKKYFMKSSKVERTKALDGIFGGAM
jgi:hypothetical protein